MKRALVIGSPGTGKTTFSKKLADKTGLPIIHIDYYYHDSSKDFYTNKPAWQKLVMGLVTKDKWIMDGNYGNTLGQRMERADTIIYFDFPRHLAIWGVIKRRLKKEPRTDMPEGWKEEAGPKFIKYVWNFKKNYKSGTERLLDQNKDKQIIILINHKQAQEYLDSVPKTSVK